MPAPENAAERMIHLGMKGLSYGLAGVFVLVVGFVAVTSVRMLTGL